MTTKTQNNGNKNLLCDGMDNKKLEHTIKVNRAHIVTFSIPAVKTCPGADKCLKSGYCHAGNFNFKSVKNKFVQNLWASVQSDFVDRINYELNEIWTFSKYVRIHPVGDFYNLGYFKKWVQIALDNPNVIFYAYTKSVNMIKGYADKYGLPANMVITYSFGGKYDDRIDKDKDKYALVISPNGPIPIGYVDGSEDDLVMCKGNDKIALRFHHTYVKWENSGFYDPNL